MNNRIICVIICVHQAGQLAVCLSALFTKRRPRLIRDVVFKGEAVTKVHISMTLNYGFEHKRVHSVEETCLLCIETVFLCLFCECLCFWFCFVLFFKRQGSCFSLIFKVMQVISCLLQFWSVFTSSSEFWRITAIQK